MSGATAAPHSGGEGGPTAAEVVILHNPACSTSRKVLALIREVAGIEPRVVEYLQSPPSRAELAELIRRMGIPARALLRRKEALYSDLGIDDPALSDDDLLDAMLTHPILIERPVVATPFGARLCRPPEAVLGILPGLPRDGSAGKSGVGPTA